MSQILDGKALARRLNVALKESVGNMSRAPGLAVVLVGEDPASEVYVRRKGKVAHWLGFHHIQRTFDRSATFEEVRDEIDALNSDPAVDGILLQLPLPGHLQASALIERIDPSKDVDGLTMVNLGRLAQGDPYLVPCTPAGIMKLLEAYDVSLQGKRACVVGRSNLVGRPIAMLLEQAHCTVTVCHSRTRDLKAHLQHAEVVIAAVGRPGLIVADWLSEESVVVDVGINRLDDGSLAGDVAFEEAFGKVKAITPVPGGVGPLTIAMLMANTAKAMVAKEQ